jgi:hypothetical protein
LRLRKVCQATSRSGCVVLIACFGSKRTSPTFLSQSCPLQSHSKSWIVSKQPPWKREEISERSLDVFRSLEVPVLKPK